MTTVTTAGLPSGTFSSADQVVGNQGGATKKLTINASSLSDYDAGSFTPTLYGSTTIGTTTYTTQTGIYRKISDLCFCAFEIVWTNFTGTGDVLIGGIPFLAKSLTGSIRYDVGISSWGDFTMPTDERIGAFIADNQNYITMLSNKINYASTMPVSVLPTSGYIRGSFNYIV